MSYLQARWHDINRIWIWWMLRSKKSFRAAMPTRQKESVHYFPNSLPLYLHKHLLRSFAITIFKFLWEMHCTTQNGLLHGHLSILIKFGTPLALPHYDTHDVLVVTGLPYMVVSHDLRQCAITLSSPSSTPPQTQHMTLSNVILPDQNNRCSTLHIF